MATVSLLEMIVLIWTGGEPCTDHRAALFFRNVHMAGALPVAGRRPNQMLEEALFVYLVGGQYGERYGVGAHPKKPLPLHASVLSGSIFSATS